MIFTSVPLPIYLSVVVWVTINIVVTSFTLQLSQNNAFRGLLIFGNGNVAKSVLSSIGPAINNSAKVYCTYRRSKPSENIRGIEYIHFSQANRILLNRRPSHILVTIPPIMATEDKSDNFYIDAILDSPLLWDSIPDDAWVGYVSTTGVYGNHDSAWVDESSATLCKADTKASAYLDIEKRWLSSPHKDVCIFRCAGLYGDSFSALHTVRRGMDEKWFTSNRTENATSRVHLLDVGRTIRICMDRNLCGIFNLADSVPEARGTVMQYAYSLLSNSNVTIAEKCENTSTDTKVPRTSSERRTRRSSESKKVSNEKMVSILSDFGGLQFPSYREGLVDVLSKNLAEWKGPSCK